MATTSAISPHQSSDLSSASAPGQAAAWDVFVGAHPAGHLLQTSGWGALKGRFGWQAELVTEPAEGDAQRTMAGALLLFQRKMGLAIGYVPRGPVVEWHNGAEARALLARLAARCRARGAAVLKIEPELADTPENRTLLYGLGLRPSAQTIQPRSTICVDLRGEEESILARMKSKWRYNIRLAQRKGVTVRPCTRADLPAVHALMAETARRDRFDVHDPAYYDAAFDLLVPDHAVFLLAEHEGTPLAAIVVAAVGTRAWYLWGASSERERNRMPNHALQWAGMQWARARGAQIYDLWGIPDELGQLAQALQGGDGSGLRSDQMPIDVDALPGDGLWGVYRFKQGFGGEVVRMAGAWDLPISAAGYAVYQAGLKALAARRTIEARRFARSQDPARFRPAANARAWRAALETLPDPHVLQSWEWGEVKSQTGWHADRMVAADGKSAFQFLHRQPIRLLPLRIGYVPKGPLLDWSDGSTAAATLDAIVDQARMRRCIVVKIDPDVPEASTTGAALLAMLRQRGWLFSREQIQFKNTAFTDLSAPEETLLDSMKSKWRYNIRLAERRGLRVRVGGTPDLRAFYQLYAETGARDGFLLRPYEYYRLVWEHFLRAELEGDNPAGGALLLAEHDEEPAPVAGLFLMRYGATTWYFYGASGDRRRRDMPNHLLQWEAMRWARSRGCTRYDWWGAPTRPEDAMDSMQGVWGFKQGFGAELQVHVGAWDYPVRPLLYRAYVDLLPRVLEIMRRRHTGQGPAGGG